MSRQLPMRFPLRERFTFERFAVGRNREPVEHLRAPVDGFRCTWLWGPSGVGKSHLLQAACHACGGAYVPAGELGDVEGYDAFERVLIDDVDTWLGDRGREEALFRLIESEGVETGEMFRVFNMGVGMVIVVSAADADSVREDVPESWGLGRVVEQVGPGRVGFVGAASERIT